MMVVIKAGGGPPAKTISHSPDGPPDVVTLRGSAEARRHLQLQPLPRFPDILQPSSMVSSSPSPVSDGRQDDPAGRKIQDRQPHASDFNATPIDFNDTPIDLSTRGPQCARAISFAELEEAPEEEFKQFTIPTPDPNHRYEITSQIGQGGMGEVVVAAEFNASSGSEPFRRVAIKLIRPEHAGDREAIARFRTEAKVAAALGSSCPHIVDIYDVGVYENEQGVKQPYLVMPLLAGEDIESRLDRQGQIGVVDTLRIASQVCRALETAHGYVTPDGKPKSIVHRDIKPANVFLVRNNGDSEVVKVLDFGIAKMEGTSPLTQSGTAMGTPYYMSPEQARGQEIDARADVYGLGAVMYHMLTGKLPFGDRESESPFTILSRVTNEALPPFADIGITHVPPEVEAIVTKCMKKHPDDRFQSAGELRAAIDATLASLEAEPRPPALPGAVNPIQLSLLPQAASPQQPVLGLSLPAANAPQLGLGSLQPHITERGFRKLGGVAPPHSDIITFEPTLSNIPAQPQITKPVTPPQKPRRRGLRYAVAVATVITLGAAAGLGWHLSRDPPQPTHVSQPARDKSSGQPQPIKQQPLQESIRTPPEKAPPAGELELVSAGPNTPPPVPLDSNAGSRSASAPETPINEPQEGRSTPEESRRHGKGRSKLRPEEDVALRPTLVPEDVELHPSKTP